MKYMGVFLLVAVLGALVHSAGASGIGSWMQVDIPGHNITLNYTASFNVLRSDTLPMSIKNIGSRSFNDTITFYEISPDSPKARGGWTGNVTLAPNESTIIEVPLNITNDTEVSTEIRIYYNVSSYSMYLIATAYYPGTAGEPPVINSWSNNKTGDSGLILTAKIDEVIRWNGSADQGITTWDWWRDGLKQNNNYDNFSTSWDTPGNKTIRMNATNANGTSNTVAWTIRVNSLLSSAPNITLWSNSRTKNDNLTLTISTGETVGFIVAADQLISKWGWLLNGSFLPNRSDTLDYTFTNEGSYSIAVRGSNDNGNTQTIVWNVLVNKNLNEKNKIDIISWYPQVIDYVYVNDTVSEEVEYSITTAEAITVNNWTVDDIPVTGATEGNTYFHTHIWDNESFGFHTVIFRGNNDGSKVEFRWYVSIYEIGRDGGNIFDVIDNALENHVTDIKIQMFESQISEQRDYRDLVAQRVNMLYDEIAVRQMKREALRQEFQQGNITTEEYVSALKMVQKEAKSAIKFAKEMAEIARVDLKDEKLGGEFDNISEILNEEDVWNGVPVNDKKKEKHKETKGNNKVKKQKKNRESYSTAVSSKS